MVLGYSPRLLTPSTVTHLISGDDAHAPVTEAHVSLVVPEQRTASQLLAESVLPGAGCGS